MKKHLFFILTFSFLLNANDLVHFASEEEEELVEQKYFTLPAQQSLQTHDYNSQRNDYIHQKISHAYNQEPLDNHLLQQIQKNAPEEVRTLVNTLNNHEIRAHWPHFVLLYGEPGVGKSTLGKYIAQTVNMPYLFISAATLADEYQNSGAQNIDRLLTEIFAMAESQPHIVIFDEINALTDKGDRKQQIDASTSMAFWTWLDRCQKQKNLIVIGTTNDLEKQRDQIGSRAGCHIITIKPLYTDEYAFNLLMCYLSEQNMDVSRASLHSVAHKFKKLPARAIEQIVSRAVQLANNRNPQAIVVSLHDLLKGLEDYHIAQNSRKGWLKVIKTKIKKGNKYIIPLISAVASLGAIYMLVPQLKHFRIQFKNQPLQDKALNQQLHMNDHTIRNEKLHDELLHHQVEAAPYQTEAVKQQVQNGPEQMQSNREHLNIAREQRDIAKEGMWWTRINGAIGIAKTICTLGLL